MADLARAGWLAPSNLSPSSPSEFKSYDKWVGPTSAPAPSHTATVVIIASTKQSPPVNQSADGIRQAATALGWKTSELDGLGTTTGYEAAFDTALSQHPDAIITVALPSQQVQGKLAQAKSQGIITIGGADVPPDKGAGSIPYDAYVEFPQSAQLALVAFEEIARTNGHADSIVLTDPAYPNTDNGTKLYSSIMAGCKGCTTHKGSYLVTDTGDAGKVTAVINGALANAPKATTLVIPFSLGLPAVVQAVKDSGRKIAIVTKDGDSQGLSLTYDKSVWAVGGSSTTWLGWASIDQVIRGMAGKPYLVGAETGLGTALVTQENAPKDASIDSVPGLPNYQAEYKKIWNVK
ncbi:sugar ABC transporter substrate-binding protein [Arthrobacter ramosus]|uniref:Sugar ABC transporter substrate-binding protein n=1 Tax=Arthrobacter ramosus TaxID=1672 RepID=A0ABV5Y6Y5_ARTRM